MRSRTAKTFLLSYKAIRTGERDINKGKTYPEPFRPLCAKTKTFETEANTGLAVIVLVGFFVAFLNETLFRDWRGGCWASRTYFATNPASVAA